MNKELIDPHAPINLHLGCGNRYLPRFTHVDFRETPIVDIVADVSDLREHFDDNTIDLVYNSCLFEHFRRPDVPRVLAEWRRVLRPGGVLRLSVPDFDKLARLYVNENVSIWRIIGPICGRQNEDWNTHYAIYDYEYLNWVLSEAGFYHIRRWNPFDTTKLPADYDDYSKAMIDNTLITLNLEATAP